MSLFSNLYVGNSGLTTSQNALNTTAHNMSNVGTKGYTRQQITQGTMNYVTIKNQPNMNAPQQTGLGTLYNNTKQVREMFLDKSFRLESGRESFYEVSYNTIEEAEDLLQEMNGQEFAEAINNLWVAAQELSKAPTEATTQATFVNRCNEFISRSQGVYKGFTEYQDRMDESIKGMVDTINALGDELFELNRQVSMIECGGVEHANDLRDRRNQILDELATYGNISYEEDAQRNVIVSFENTSFVCLDMVNHIGLDTDASPDGFYTPYWEFAAKDVSVLVPGTGGATGVPAQYEMQKDITGARIVNLSLPVSSDMNTDVGKLRATLLARGDHHATYHDLSDDATGTYYNQGYNENGKVQPGAVSVANSVIMNLEAEFDQLFNTVVTAINDVMRNALSNPATVSGEGSTEDYVMFQMSFPTAALNYDIDADHKAGKNLMGLSITNTEVNSRLLQDPTTFNFRTVTGDQDEAAMRDLKAAFTTSKYTINPNVVATTSINGYYNAYVTQISTSGSVYKGIRDFQEQTVDGLDQAREQVTGVNQDEELQYMIQFQNAFNASSRYINVVNELLNHLLTSLA